jgi:8-oxo-dGTP diphosphatase
MAPEWFAVDSLPFTRMWNDDPLWLPLVLGSSLIEAKFVFEGEEIVEKNVQTVAFLI